VFNAAGLREKFTDNVNSKEKGRYSMEKERKEEELVESEETETETIEPAEDDARFDKIYSNIASNRYENLRTSYIENKAKELRKRKK